jgi:hypothetical protein
MPVVPYIFANQSGQIPLSELDANFANVKAFADTAGNVTGNIQANITAVGTLTTLTVSGNVTAPTFVGNLVGNIGGNISVPGSNTQILFNDNGVANANAGLTFNKATNQLFATGSVNAIGNITGAAVLASGGTIGTPVGVLTMRLGNNNPSTIWIGGNATNVHIANVNSTTSIGGNLTVGSLVTATGNVTGGNIDTAGLITATGNITGGNLLTGGSLTATGNVTGGNVGTAGLISATGNVTGGNVGTAGVVTATGTITGGNILTAGLISATGNVTAGNIDTAGVMTATGTITGGNVSTAGAVTATGNITGGNLLTGGALTATGNITGGNLSISGISILTGVATAPTAANGTSNTQVATTAFVTNSLLNLVPSGVIVMWSGIIASIPTGWALCNGANGTPDLRDRFIVGAGNIYTPSNTGGSADSIVVAHTHTASSSVTDPGHAHSYTAPASATSDATGVDTEIAATTASTTGSANTGITVSTTVNSTGSSGTNANLPPYYALAYIMKT